MQEKEWEEKYIENNRLGTYKVYMGIPLGRDIIIKLHNGQIIIGEFKSVSENSIDGDSIDMYCRDGWKSINMNKIKSIDLYEDCNYELDDIVEIDNVDNLNPSWLYSNVIGLQGKISVIDNVSSKTKVYYTVDLPIPKQYEYLGVECITSGQLTFAEENLKLIK